MLSKHNPLLPRRWNSGLLRLVMECPRKLLLGGIQGWRTKEESAHLDFGSMLQECQDTFLRARLAGAAKEEATLEAVKRALQISGQFLCDDDDTMLLTNPPKRMATYDWHPWGGRYQTLWRCTGTEPYRNEKGNKAKCPYSHAGKWFPVDLADPDYDVIDLSDGDAHTNCRLECRECGSSVETADHYIPQHPTKNRVTLLRAVVALCDSQAEEGGIQPVRLPSGKDAVELEVVVPLGRKTPDTVVGDWVPVLEEGEDYELVCHFDEMVTYRGRTYVLDNKTTSQAIDDNTRSGRAWWQQWAPNVQIDLYDLAGSLAFPDLDVAGCAVRGIQVTREQANVGVKLITKTEGQREEFLADIHHYLDRAEEYARTGHFPMNRAACKGCQFAPVCDMDPAFREATLRADYVQQPDERLFLPQEEEQNAE